MKPNLTIQDHTVHLWRIELSLFSAQENYYLNALSSDECERANRFRFPLHRQRFVLARGILREILSLYLNVSANEIIFTYSSHGKPSLLNNRLNLKFNLSHSHDFAVIAITKNHEIGVDVEKMQDSYNDAIAKRFFTELESTELRKLPDNERVVAFFRLWSFKEALIKAVGEGLYVPLGKFSIALHDNMQWVLFVHAQYTEKYYLENFRVHGDYQAAFATNQVVDTVLYWDWTIEGAKLTKTLCHRI